MSNPRTVFVDVTIQQVDPLAFTVTPSPLNNPQLPTKPNGDIIFHNDHHNGFRIHFVLQGDTFGYLFPPTNDKANAVWSQLGSVCPDRVQVADVFLPLYVTPDRRTLVVYNPNPTPPQGEFQYNLRVTNGQDWKNLDPGGDNNNGPPSLTSLSYAAVGVIAAATGVLSALATTAALANFNLVCDTPGF